MPSTRDLYTQLDTSLRADPKRVKRIRAKIGNEAWAHYESIGTATCDEDFFSSILEFIVSIKTGGKLDDLRSELNSDQSKLVDAMSSAMQKELGLTWT